MAAIDYQEFELRLQSMKETFEANITRLTEEMKAIATDDGINDMGDLASMESESVHHNALLAQQKHELGEVVHALSKFKDGSYGICEQSGDTISVERLRAEPYARYCVKDAKKAGS